MLTYAGELDVGGSGERGNDSILHSTEGGMEKEASEARKMVKPTAEGEDEDNEL
jgi:hypothetical protein